MTLRRISLAACLLFALAGTTAQAGAQAPADGAPMARPDDVPKKTQAALKDALMKIRASPDANEALLNLVRAHDSAKVRAMLIQYGVKPGDLRHVVVDALGPTQGARKLVPLTIYFDVIPQGGNVPEPVGLVYIGGHWVDWNDQPSWYWWVY